MTYVLIHGRGLMGLGLGDPSEGAPLDIARAGNGPRGPVGGRSIGVRAFQRSNAGLPPSALSGLHGPLRITVEHDGGLAGGRRAPRGLGSVDNTDVRSHLDQLVAVAHDQTQAIVASSGLLSRATGAPQEWATSVVNFAQFVRAQMLAERNGQPFFVREPEAAARLIASSARDIDAMTRDFAEATSTLVPGSFSESIHMVLAGVTRGIVQGASTAVRAAVEEAGKLPPLPGGMPGWLAPLAAVVGLAIVAKVVL